MTTKELTDVIKGAHSVTDANGKSVVLADEQGNFGKIEPSALVPMSLDVRTPGGFTFRGYGLYLCFAYRESNHFVNCFFVISAMPYNGTNNNSPYVVLKSNGLDVNAINAFGTSSFRLADGSTDIPDVKIRTAYFAF